MPLTATEVKQAKPKDKDYKLSDEKGLFLLVKKNGAKYWRWKYRFAKKEKLLALGVFPEVSLKEARNKRDDARKLLSNGSDPSAVKQAQKQAILTAHENTFELIAREWFKTKMADKSQSHQDRTLRALEKDLFPFIGTRPIEGISAPELLNVLRKIEKRGAIETAHRAKQTTGQIFRYGIATGRCENDLTSGLTGALKTPQETHFPAITEPAEVGKLMLAIEGFRGTPIVKSALSLSPLLFTRPGEIRHMEWSEIDWNAAQWEIPEEKMKMREAHIVPLATQALDILREQQRLTGRYKYVFPNARGASRPLSENGVRTALRTMGYDNETMTPHGFRAMARTLLDEQLGYRVDWIEHQLAHAVRDNLGRAYNRTKHLNGRTEMMQAWADYLDSLKEKARNGSAYPLSQATSSA
mgnify:CR=1 FL=1